MKRNVRVLHKYFSLIVSVQLMLWTISGIFFAFNKIELIRGEGYLVNQDASVSFENPEFEIRSSDSVIILKRLDKTVFMIQNDDDVSYLDSKGENIPKLDFRESQEIVRSVTSLNPVAVTEINEDYAGSEYRGRKLPLYKISSFDKDGKEINVYLNPFSGKVEAIRTLSWRVWDFLWGLPIIDWKERDNINNIFLQVFSLLALVSSITGIILFFRTLRQS